MGGYFKSDNMENKKRFCLKEKYLESWNYIKECKNFILVVVGLFFVFSLIGFFIPASAEVENQILEFLKELLEKTQGMSAFGLMKFIFFNNFQASLTGILFGVLLGIFPVIVASLNGYILGFVASKTVSINGIFSLWRILPHGIFELPAVFISLAMGIKLGTFIFAKKKLEACRDFFWKSIKVFLLIVVPLLFIAGVIEGLLIAFAS